MILLPDPEDTLTEASIKAMLMTLEPMKTRFQRLLEACNKCGAIITMAKAPALSPHVFLIKSRFKPLTIDYADSLADRELTHVQAAVRSYLDEVRIVNCKSPAVRGGPVGRAASAKNGPR